jgi:uncharacterized membrane protein
MNEKLIRLAQGPVNNPPGPENQPGVFRNPLQATDIVGLVTSIIEFLLRLAAVGAVVAIIFGAFMLIFSLGDEQRVKNGKQIIFWAVIGLILIGASLVIVQFTGQALGLQIQP